MCDYFRDWLFPDINSIYLHLARLSSILHLLTPWEPANPVFYLINPVSDVLTSEPGQITKTQRDQLYLYKTEQKYYKLTQNPEPIRSKLPSRALAAIVTLPSCYHAGHHLGFSVFQSISKTVGRRAKPMNNWVRRGNDKVGMVWMWCMTNTRMLSKMAAGSLTDGLDFAGTCFVTAPYCFWPISDIGNDYLHLFGVFSPLSRLIQDDRRRPFWKKKLGHFFRLTDLWSVRPSVVTKRISEILTRIIPKVGQEAGWPSTPGVFFIFLILAIWQAFFLVAIGRFRPFFDFERHFLKNCLVTFFLIAHRDAN